MSCWAAMSRSCHESVGVFLSPSISETFMRPLSCLQSSSNYQKDVPKVCENVAKQQMRPAPCHSVSAFLFPHLRAPRWKRKTDKWLWQSMAMKHHANVEWHQAQNWRSDRKCHQVFAIHSEWKKQCVNSMPGFYPHSQVLVLPVFPELSFLLPCIISPLTRVPPQRFGNVATIVEYRVGSSYKCRGPALLPMQN